MRALEESGRGQIREREEQLHDLRQERLSLTQNLSEAQDRYLQIYEEVERAREANSRFQDVKRMLQLSEEERVRLIDRVEELTEETSSWRPLKHKMEGRVQQLEEEAARQRAEIDRLKGLEEQLRAEKERNLANQIQIQSWQDICSELQTKCDRWEQVKDSLELTLKATQTDVTKLRSEREKLDKAKRTYYEMLVDLNVDVAEEEEHSDAEEEEEEEELDMDAEVDPLTTLRTMSLLKGQLPEVGVPQEDTEAVGVDELAEIPPYGSVDEGAPQILRVQ